MQQVPSQRERALEKRVRETFYHFLQECKEVVTSIEVKEQMDSDVKKVAAILGTRKSDSHLDSKDKTSA